MNDKFQFKAKLWKDKAPGAWYFVSAPKVISKKIRESQFESEEGWGRLKANISVKNSTWNTSIWFDTKMNTYLIPIKSVIRKKEGLTDGSVFLLEISFESCDEII
jgi:hypothetical protein